MNSPLERVLLTGETEWLMSVQSSHSRVPYIWIFDVCELSYLKQHSNLNIPNIKKEMKDKKEKNKLPGGETEQSINLGRA